MAQPDAAAPKQAEAKIAEIHRVISTMRYVSSGTLLKRMKRCGNSQCHCARDRTNRHGPCYRWSYLKAGRLHHRTLSSKQAELYALGDRQLPQS
jgi:hypothetical protein